MGYGSPQKYVLIGQESAWGTAVTCDKDVGLVLDVTDGGSREVTESMSMSRIDTQAVKTQSRDDKTSMTVEFQHGRLLEYALGSVTHATTSSDTFHTYTATVSPPSCSIETGSDLTTDTTSKHEGNLLESLEISTALDQNVQMKAEFSGQTFNTGSTASTPVVSTLAVLPHPIVSFTLNGVTPSEVQEASIKIVKKVVKAYGLGNEEPQSGKATELKYEWSAKLAFDAKTYHDLFADNTSFTATLSADNGTALGSGQRAFTATLANCSIKKFDETATVGNLTFIDISGVGTFGEFSSVDNISSGSW